MAARGQDRWSQSDVPAEDTSADMTEGAADWTGSDAEVDPSGVIGFRSHTVTVRT